MEKAIQVKNLWKSYGDTNALKGLSLEVEQGEIYGLIGPDGAGKTTLIRILTSLIYADKGEASVLGLDPDREFKKLRQIYGYMPGRFSLYQDLTVEENLSLFASIYDTSIEENYHLVRDIYVQIEPFKTRRAGALSGGMKQKLALCCAMIHKPEILFLDEPTTGVDPVSRKEFWEMLGALNSDGLTILVSTPYMDEADRCHRVALMQTGEILAVDTPDTINERFNRPLHSVKGVDKYALIKELKSYKSYESVYSFGSELHYTDQRNGDQSENVTAYLRQKGHDDIEIKLIEPGIEDTFILLMTRQNG